MTHQVNKYYNYDSLSFAQKATEQDVLQGKSLSDKHIENLCSGYLTNAIYANIVEGNKNYEQAREESAKIAGKVVIKHGEEIKEQLSKNDRAGLEAQNLGTSPSSDHKQAPSNQDQPNTSEDITKISGGSMAKIITKIAEIIASLPPQEQDSAAQNFSAMFSVLGISFDTKIDQTMQTLAPNPVVVASIKNTLEGTEGGKVFDKLIETHLDDNQKEAVDKVSKEDLEAYKEEKTQQQKKQTSLYLS